MPLQFSELLSTYCKWIRICVRLSDDKRFSITDNIINSSLASMLQLSINATLATYVLFAHMAFKKSQKSHS